MTAAYDEVMRSWKRAGREDSEDLALHPIGELNPAERTRLNEDLVACLVQGTKDDRIARALRALPGEDSLTALQRYARELRALQRPLDTTGVEAILSLAALAGFDDSSTELLLRVLEAGDAGKPRSIAAFELRNAAPSSSVVSGLISALDGEDRTVRLNAADSLLSLHGAASLSERARRTLSLELHSSSATLRQRALADLGAMERLSLTSARSDDALFALARACASSSRRAGDCRRNIARRTENWSGPRGAARSKRQGLLGGPSRPLF